MPYLSGFDADFFISYGHQDDSPLSTEEKHWVDRFHQDLTTRVSQYLGSPVTAWRDLYLTGSHDFEAEILAKLKGTAVLIPIVSPRFLGSPWCQRELQVFLQTKAQNGGIGVGTSRRILKVVKTFVDLNEQPEIMRQLLGYEFYRIDERGRPREFPDWDPAPDAQKKYLARLDDVSYDLHTLLKEMKVAESQVQHLPTEAVQPAGKSIYLAESTRDMSETRDQIRRELLAHGYTVLPDQLLPDDAAELRSVAAEYLDSCCLSLHLIGGKYAKVPEGDNETRSIVWQQQELALQRQSQGNFDCISWMAPDTQVTDNRQKEFMTWLEEHLGTDKRFEFLRTPLDGLKNFVFDRLAPDAPTAVDAPEEKTGRIYLICELGDYDAIRPIRDHLEDCGVSVDLPLWEGDQTEIRLDRESTLLECDGVLIYHGVGSEGWLREKMRELRRSKGQGRTRPFLPQGIYIGPVSTPGKERFIDRDYVVIRDFGEFKPEALRPFISGIRTAVGAGV